MGTSSSHQAMRSEAVLLVLLAAPCVVESAAAFPKAVVEVETVLKAMQESKQLTAPNKKGLLAAKDAMKCSTDYSRLMMNKKYLDDHTACDLACATSNMAVYTNMAAGASTTSCNTDAACTKFKKTCAAEAGWGFYVDNEISIAIKDHTAYKDSTHAMASMRCYPASCEGTDMGSSEHAWELKAGTTGPSKMSMGSSDGVTYTATTVVEKMPAPMWFYILIVVVVLSIACIVCCIKRGCCKCCGKCCPQGGAKEPTKDIQMAEQK